VRSILNNPKFTGTLALGAVLALGWTTANELYFKPNRSRRPVAPTPNPDGRTTPATNASPDTFVPAGKPMDRPFVRSRYPRWIQAPNRNPFAITPPDPTHITQPSPTNPLPVLSVISRGPAKSVVVLNGRTFVQGQETAGYRIDQIEDSAVILRDAKDILHRVSLPWTRNATPRTTSSVSGPNPAPR